MKEQSTAPKSPKILETKGIDLYNSNKPKEITVQDLLDKLSISYDEKHDIINIKCQSNLLIETENSIFISKKNIQYEKSLEYAKSFAKELIAQGLSPSLHHAEEIEGENRQLIDDKLGIYLFDDLKVLRNSKSAAFLFEAGIIVNPVDEKKVKTKAFRDKIIRAMMKLFN